MLKEKAIELIQETTVYGLPKLLRSKQIFSKVLWLIFLLLSPIPAFIFIYKDIVDFSDLNVVTAIKTEYDQPTEFPTVTFCSFLPNLYDNFSAPGPLSSSHFAGDFDIGMNPNNHYESFMTPLGKCYRFNSGKNMKNESIPIKNSTFGGIWDAFYLDLYAPYGLAVWIHNKTSPPLIEGRNEIIASPERLNHISVEKTFESKLEEPYNHCLKNVSTFNKNKTIIDFFLNKKQSYSQEKCLDICFQLFYIQENPCQCNETTLGNVMQNCFSKKKELFYCTLNYRANFSFNRLKDKCSEYCPLECDSITYSISINQITKDVFELYQLSSGYEKNRTYILINYNSLKYISIKQQPEIHWFRMVSNIGGYLSLFLGLSFVSLFEITEITFEIIFALFSRRRIQQNNKTNQSFDLRKYQQASESANKMIMELTKQLDELNNRLKSTKIAFDNEIKELNKQSKDLDYFTRL